VSHADCFDSVVAAAEVMSGFAHPWWIAGGWAIDLFVGRVTREHGDIEIGAFRDTQAALHEHLREFKLFKAVDGEFVPWPAGDDIVLPVFQIQATDESLPGGELQVFLDDRVDGRWICRRNALITRPVDEITFPSRGVRALCPEIQLLFKAKHHAMPKNEQDFSVAVPLLSPAERSWLKESIIATHPGNPWIARLCARTN
jgi:hypothetical protein